MDTLRTQLSITRNLRIVLADMRLAIVIKRLTALAVERTQRGIYEQAEYRHKNMARSKLTSALVCDTQLVLLVNEVAFFRSPP